MDCVRKIDSLESGSINGSGICIPSLFRDMNCIVIQEVGLRRCSGSRDRMNIGVQRDYRSEWISMSGDVDCIVL